MGFRIARIYKVTKNTYYSYMATQIEEQQARDFLKRAEIKTMRKDLLKLREADSLKERDKIAQIKTLDEQRAEQQKKLEALELEKSKTEKSKREEVLRKNEHQEYEAEKDLKNYATEEERQQIFLFESQRVGFEKHCGPDFQGHQGPLQQSRPL